MHHLRHAASPQHTSGTSSKQNPGKSQTTKMTTGAIPESFSIQQQPGEDIKRKLRLKKLQNYLKSRDAIFERITFTGQVPDHDSRSNERQLQKGRVMRTKYIIKQHKNKVARAARSVASGGIYISSEEELEDSLERTRNQALALGDHAKNYHCSSTDNEINSMKNHVNREIIKQHNMRAFNESRYNFAVKHAQNINRNRCSQLRVDKSKSQLQTSSFTDTFANSTNLPASNIQTPVTNQQMIYDGFSKCHSPSPSSTYVSPKGAQLLPNSVMQTKTSKLLIDKLNSTGLPVGSGPGLLSPAEKNPVFLQKISSFKQALSLVKQNEKDIQMVQNRLFFQTQKSFSFQHPETSPQKISQKTIKSYLENGKVALNQDSVRMLQPFETNEGRYLESTDNLLSSNVTLLHLNDQIVNPQIRPVSQSQPYRNNFAASRAQFVREADDGVGEQKIEQKSEQMNEQILEQSQGHKLEKNIEEESQCEQQNNRMLSSSKVESSQKGTEASQNFLNLISGSLTNKIRTKTQNQLDLGYSTKTLHKQPSLEDKKSICTTNPKSQSPQLSSADWSTRVIRKVRRPPRETPITDNFQLRVQNISRRIFALESTFLHERMNNAKIRKQLEKELMEGKRSSRAKGTQSFLSRFEQALAEFERRKAERGKYHSNKTFILDDNRSYNFKELQQFLENFGSANSQQEIQNKRQITKKLRNFKQKLHKMNDRIDYDQRVNQQNKFSNEFSQKNLGHIQSLIAFWKQDKLSEVATQQMGLGGTQQPSLQHTSFHDRRLKHVVTSASPQVQDYVNQLVVDFNEQQPQVQNQAQTALAKQPTINNRKSVARKSTVNFSLSASKALKGNPIHRQSEFSPKTPLSPKDFTPVSFQRQSTPYHHITAQLDSSFSDYSSEEQLIQVTDDYNAVFRPAFRRLIQLQEKIDRNLQIFQEIQTKQFLSKIANKTYNRQLLASVSSSMMASYLTQMMQQQFRKIFSTDQSLKLYRNLPKKLKKMQIKYKFNLSLTDKYLDLDKNQYRNEFLRQLINGSPTFKKRFKVFNLYKKRVSQNIDRVYNSVAKQQLVSKVISDKNLHQKLSEESIDAEDDIDALKGFSTYYKEHMQHKPLDTAIITIAQGGLLAFLDKKLDYHDCVAIRDYLGTTQDKKNHVALLVFDSCQLSDECMEIIFQGVERQIKRNRRGGKANKQYFNGFVIINQQLGQKTLQKLLKLENGIFEVKFSNLRPHPTQGHLSINQILDPDRFQYILKLSLTSMNLGSDTFVSKLCDFIITRDFLQLLDISKASLNGNQLTKILQTILEMPDQLRDINMSHNRLKFIEKNQQIKCPASLQPGSMISVPEMSIKTFIETFKSLLSTRHKLGHLNLSGMRFTPESLLDLCSCISKSQSIQIVHLSDNGISQDLDLYTEIVDLFSIEYSSLPKTKMLTQEQRCHYAHAQFPRDKNLVDFEKRFDKYFHKQSVREWREQIKDGELRKEEGDHQSGDQFPKKQANATQNLEKEYYLKHLITGQQAKSTKKRDQIWNQSTTYNGLNRATTNLHDSFIVSRLLKHPELIFRDVPQTNTGCNAHNNTQFQYFEKDFSSKWRLSEHDQCYLCDKYKYVAVFYERGVFSGNKDLTEIKDPALIEYFKQQYLIEEMDRDESAAAGSGGGSDQELQGNHQSPTMKNKTMTPVIYGTLSSCCSSLDSPFQRKLKMLRTPLFALLAVINCNDFLQKSINSEAIKDMILNYLQYDIDEVMKQENVRDSVNGWHFIIQDFLLNNEIMDTMSINQPDLSFRKLQKQDWYTFAGLFPPGYHKIVIYDPLLERAFARDFVVELGTHEFLYPEFPEYSKNWKSNIVPNMWQKWKEEAGADYLSIMSLDVGRKEFFQSRVVKKFEPVELKAILDYFQKNYGDVLTLQKLLLSKSAQTYPEISMDAAIEFFESVQRNEHEIQKMRKVARQTLQQCYAQAVASLSDKDFRGSQSYSRQLSVATPMDSNNQGSASPQKTNDQDDKISGGFSDKVQAIGPQSPPPVRKGTLYRSPKFQISRGLQRSNLLIFLIQIFSQFHSLNFPGKDQVPLSQKIDFLFKIFVQSQIRESCYHVDREEIRQSKALNELLYDNVEGLQELFREARVVGNKKKKAKKLNFERASAFFGSFKPQTLQEQSPGVQSPNFAQNNGQNQTVFQKSQANHKSPYKICQGSHQNNSANWLEQFTFSKMTVWNETVHMEQYNQLSFTEFQEMLCRIALSYTWDSEGTAGSQDVDSYQQQYSVAQKVYNLLEVIYQKKYDSDAWTKQDFPLFAPNDEVADDESLTSEDYFSDSLVATPSQKVSSSAVTGVGGFTGTGAGKEVVSGKCRGAGGLGAMEEKRDAGEQIQQIKQLIKRQLSGTFPLLHSDLSKQKTQPDKQKGKGLGKFWELMGGK